MKCFVFIYSCVSKETAWSVGQWAALTWLSDDGMNFYHVGHSLVDR